MSLQSGHPWEGNNTSFLSGECLEFFDREERRFSLHVSTTTRAVIKGRGPGIFPGYYVHDPCLLLYENRRKIKPNKIPSCCIPCLLVPLVTWKFNDRPGLLSALQPNKELTIAQLKLTACQWTMSGQNGILTGWKHHSLIKMTSYAHSYSRINSQIFNCIP